jgi:hypothetical protein
MHYNGETTIHSETGEDMRKNGNAELASQLEESFAGKKTTVGGLSALGTAVVLGGVYFLGRRWINRHYDNRALEIRQETKGS